MSRYDRFHNPNRTRRVTLRPWLVARTFFVSATALALFLLLCGGARNATFAQANTQDNYRLRDGKLGVAYSHFFQASPEFPDLENATKLIETLLGKPASLRKDDYCIVHVVRWKNFDQEGKKFESDDLWYLYRKNKDGNDGQWIKQSAQRGKPIYGSERVAVLSVHSRALRPWDIKYEVESAPKLPTPFQNLLQLVSVAGLTEKGAAAIPFVDLWGGQLLSNITKLPADLTVQGNTIFQRRKYELPRSLTASLWQHLHIR